MRLWLLVIACAACGPTIVNDHGGKGAADMSKHLPATLEATRPREGDPKSIHVRVWVDAGIRALPKWREEIIDQFDYASQLLTPLIGARLAIDKVSEWNRTSDPQAALAALAEVDKGDGVTWVIGYVTPGDVASKAMSELGNAEPLGKYVVVRGWSEKAETTALTSFLPDIKDAERTEILSAHRRHKQTVVLLHMLAVTLGAIDEADPTWIQNPLYAPKQATFSERNRELLQIGLDERVAPEATDQTLAKKLLEAIEKSEFGGWVPASHEEVTKRLRNVIDAHKAGRTASAIPAAAYDQYSRIKTLAGQGKAKDAVEELENLLIAYPGNAAMHQLRCEIMLAVSGPSAPKPKPAPKQPPKTPPKKDAPKPKPPPPSEEPIAYDWKAACAKASDLAPGDPTPHVAVAEAYANAKDYKSARAELSAAETKVANLPSGAEDAWKKIVGTYHRMGALTWTEEAITKAKLEKDPIAQTIAQTRARYGVPRGAKFVAPDQESALVLAVRTSLDLIYASKYAEAERALAEAERKWPGAAGLWADRCDLGLRQGSLDTARAACARALATDPQDSWALYLSGVISLKTAAGTKDGIEQLKKAIAVDPDLGQAWRTLGKAYQRTKDQAALEQLAKDYQTRFNQPLPQ